MSFGNIIKKLRQERKLTQEQLAGILSISPQAISRWETNLALPDISLLPTLANYFDVTTDYLLEVDISKKEKEISRYLEEARSYTCKGMWSKGIEILQSAIKKHPNAYNLINELAYAIYCSPQETNKWLSENVLTEIINLEETVLTNSNNTELRTSAIALLCQLYPAEKAEALAQTMPSIYQSKEVLLASLYKGTKRFNQVQDNIFSYLELLLLNLTTNNAPLDDKTKAYSFEEMIDLNKRKIDILNLIFEDKNYGFFSQTVCWTYLDIAWFYAALKNKTQTLKYLKLAKNQAIANDIIDYNPDTKYTGMVFKGRRYGEIRYNITENDSTHQLKEMNDKVYDFIREDKEFIDIINKLIAIN